MKKQVYKNIFIILLFSITSSYSEVPQINYENENFSKSLTKEQKELLNQEKEIIIRQREILRQSLSETQLQIVNNNSIPVEQRLLELSKSLTKDQMKLLRENEIRLASIKEQFNNSLSDDQISILNNDVISNKLRYKIIKGEIFYQNDSQIVSMIIPKKSIINNKEPNYEKLQYKIEYIDDNGDRISLKPQDIKEIRFKYTDEIIRMVSVKNTIGLGKNIDNIMLKLEIDGKLKLFTYYYTLQSPGVFVPGVGVTGRNTKKSHKYIIQKVDGKLLLLKRFTYKKALSNYLSDCKVVSNSIKDIHYRLDDILKILNIYNINCSN